MSKEIDNVREFCELIKAPKIGDVKVDQISFYQQRLAYILEEVSELSTAMNKQDIPEIFDALIDIVYFVKGTSILMGLPWDEAWDAVHNANMQKQAGKSKRGFENGDAQKPIDWKPADLVKIIEEAKMRPKYIEHTIEEFLAK